MSRKCCNYCGSYGYGQGCGLGYGLGHGASCCNFPSFIILILILLQFRGHSHHSDGPCDGNNGGVVDKGILFIIALYYLSCCSPAGRRLY